MAQLQLVKHTSSGVLLPATPESGEFLHSVKIGEWIHADFKRVRNYAFHKRFFKLLQLGFDCWTPAGGSLSPDELQLVNRFVGYLVEMSGQRYGEVLSAAADEFLLMEGQLRTRDVALLKSFEPYRAWVTVQAGYYDEVILPDNTRRRTPKSIAFARMDEGTFRQLYKDVFNVLWNFILRHKFRSQQEAENVAMQLLEFA
ncbi:DUF1367 domain-containing protein [Salmonella enterica subsp. diarizonae]|uniref:DUF1367 family protein n=2 Tax=Salmonella enterica TaxID=28901 RepID=A0A403T557_SALER|nr:DUF1367 family protein [Salmonella enterica]EBW3412595.1 DUF1367 family protein [Salmonella enterica subsp. enterica serovar Newport]ECU8748697.1 DUF1367 family protein [Salmonella enterica subsp. diarizonae str. CFSAN000558]EKR1624152.1 DUF1367 family protein [Salmonella enterica subsp. diarizonae serovar 50:k:z:[z50],[z57],[z68], [z86]]HAE8381920.1 DUF1367 family protein [Salmonella enterica subsp. diarizonae serovar 50:k:z]HEB6454611.1 DUF1367 family protein [Salmonella enterica subsp. e